MRDLARRLLARVLVIGLAAATAGAVTATSGSAAARHDPDLGANVTVFDPAMPVAAIQAAVDAVAARQVDDEMGTGRYAFLFKPGTYGTAEHPLEIRVGYYTEISGLGATPGDVVINGKIEVYNRCFGSDGCFALDNFWRTVSNLSLHINGAGQDSCRQTANFYAVSQASSIRRVDVSGGTLSFMDYCTAGPQYASGGFVADSRLPAVVNGSQQQWLTRNSSVASWSNGVWNQVFSGVSGAPADTLPYTTLPTTPVSREKPFLYVDSTGAWQVRVPSARRNSSGVSWATGLTAGRSLPLRSFFIAKPSDPAWLIEAHLLLGRNVLLTPGVYSIGHTLDVRRPNQVVLGIGQATLTSAGGATPIRVGDVPGVIIAGVTFDAGPQPSRALLQVGTPAGPRQAGCATGPLPGGTADGRVPCGTAAGCRCGSANDPTLLADVYFRVGGPHIGRVHAALEVNSDHVIIDHTWVWRADHGVEGFTGDTQRWNTNISPYGVIVNGANVTATGLFVEHFQKYNTTWNGDNGTTIFYQNELPYDPPTQADWTDGDTLGYAGYHVGAHVKTHSLYGAGVYVFNRNNPTIHTANGFEVPTRPGIQLHHIMTVNLSAGTIDHVVDGFGPPATTAAVGVPVTITDYPSR